MRLALFVASDVRLAPRDEFGEFVDIRHGRSVAESARCVSKDGAAGTENDGTSARKFCFFEEPSAMMTNLGPVQNVVSSLQIASRIDIVFPC